MSVLEQLEMQLGCNLQLLSDKLDLLRRQKDPETIQALQDITHAWETIAVLLATEKLAKKQNLSFAAVQDGNSITDTLFRYATELFPRAAACKRAIEQTQSV